jgi:hypothetical protein
LAVFSISYSAEECIIITVSIFVLYIISIGFDAFFPRGEFIIAAVGRVAETEEIMMYPA